MPDLRELLASQHRHIRGLHIMMQLAIGLHVAVAALAAAALSNGGGLGWVALLGWNAVAAVMCIKSSSRRWAEWLKLRADLEREIVRREAASAPPAP